MRCPECGSEDIDASKCPVCNGTGGGSVDDKDTECEYCGGTGDGQEGFSHCSYCGIDF